MRQIILDTETTGLEIRDNHKIIEICALEMIDRRYTERVFHEYIDPQRTIDDAAVEIHGVTEEFLRDKPVFKDIAKKFLAFIKDAELIIHNAPFDVGFINYEFVEAGMGDKVIENNCTVLDTLSFARQLHPGQKNNLDALCKRYNVNDERRAIDGHSALLDTQLLAQVYLQMTGGQTSLLNEPSAIIQLNQQEKINLNVEILNRLPQAKATDDEVVLHNKWMELLASQATSK